MCGGTGSCRNQIPCRCGLSPRVRGNPYNLCQGAHAVGSIPACAGEPGNWTHWQYAGGVYPRVCGGTSYPAAAASPSAGLSPRVLGNLALETLAVNAIRSIPACAGEPNGGMVFLRQARVYPRVCGGTMTMDRGQSYAQGLSPRVRGNPHGRCAGTRPTRSIPACAGEPEKPLMPEGKERVYPRVCGGT